MTYRNIIFDLDGTLIDSARISGQIIDQMFSDRGIPEIANRDLIRKMDAVGGEPMIAAVMGHHSRDPAADLDEFRTHYRAIAIPADLPFPGIAETLQELSNRGVGMAICSNKPQILCDKILSELDLSHLFADIIGSQADRPRKPDPASAQLALAVLGAAAQDTLFCGDSLVDVATANAAGVDICLVHWGYGTKEAIELHPDLRLISRSHDLLSLAQGGRIKPFHD